MRRSCAPSMRKGKAAQVKEANNFENGAAQDNKRWGTSDSSGWGTKENAAKSSKASQGKSIFRVVWREMSKRKNKSWKGDGTLEVQLDSKRAVLKDETGKYLGSTTNYKPNELAEGLQMIVGGKEIELQEPIHADEFWAMRKLQVANRAWGEEEWQPAKERAAEENKPKGAFVFRPSLVLETPKMPKTALGSASSVGNPAGQNEKKLKRDISQLENYTWGTEKVEYIIKSSRDDEMPLASKKIKDDFALHPNLLDMPLRSPKTCLCRNEAKSTSSCEQVALILPTPGDYIAHFNPEKRLLQEVCVAETLVRHLRPHQHEGVAFLYNCLMGFGLPECFGAILADEMGLGKTLQCLTVAHTMLRGGPFGERVLQRVLIVTPSSLTANWNAEVSKWLKAERMFAFVVDGKHTLGSYSRQQHVPFVIASYETLQSQVAEFEKLKFDLLICDEGHRLKNRETKTFATLQDLNIRKRLIVTGTPVQNNLQEFFALAQFVNPGVFGEYAEFRQQFELPLQQSQSPAASEEVKKLASLRSAELKALSSQFLLRRLQQVNCQYLPKKHDYICFVRPSELQLVMLQKALDLYEKRKETILKDLSPLQVITILKKICNHPSLVARTRSPNLLTRNLERLLPDWTEMGPFDSGKLEVVQHFLTATAVERREKCVLVSNHTKTLNMLQGLCDFLNLKCLRLDGTTPAAERHANVAAFNMPAAGDDDALIFLLSAKAGGVGLNLIGASRLLLYDNDWNPATDSQAMARIWRDGQQRDVQIYRLITAGCLEEKIFQRQVAKMSLGDCVLSGAGEVQRHETLKFSDEELLDLFTLQQDLDTCQTHALLGCDCCGDGQNAIDKTNATKDDKQINELMQWQHYQTPFNESFLEKACLSNANANLLYIFANQTESVA